MLCVSCVSSVLVSFYSFVCCANIIYTLQERECGCGQKEREREREIHGEESWGGGVGEDKAIN